MTTKPEPAGTEPYPTRAAGQPAVRAGADGETVPAPAAALAPLRMVPNKAGEIVQAITREEKQRFHELEQVVEQHMAEFLAVGRALMEIRDRKLFRGYSLRWGEYLRVRWGLSKASGDNKIRAAQVHEILRESGRFEDGELPRTIRQATALPPHDKASGEQMADIWQKALAESEPGHVSSATVAAAGKALNPAAYQARNERAERQNVNKRKKAEAILVEAFGPEKKRQVLALFEELPVDRRRRVLRALGTMLGCVALQLGSRRVPSTASQK